MATAEWRPRVGDRVRVRLRRDRLCNEAPHIGEDGRMGRVIRDVPLAHLPSHPYLVLFDPPTNPDQHGVWATASPARHYAADELEPLDN